MPDRSMSFARAGARFAGCALALGSLGALPVAARAAAPNPRVAMTIEKRGTFVIELFPKAAPKTVAHFLSLVKSHFYDGILFHRYVQGFVVQGGDPKSKTVKPEDIANISAEEVGDKYGLGAGGSTLGTVPLEATLPHDRGTIGLARSQAPDSGDSQFFINLAPNHRLDYQYCVFGKVVQGMDKIDQIRQGDRIKSIRLAPAPEKK